MESLKEYLIQDGVLIPLYSEDPDDSDHGEWRQWRLEDGPIAEREREVSTWLRCGQPAGGDPAEAKNYPRAMTFRLADRSWI